MNALAHAAEPFEPPEPASAQTLLSIEGLATSFRRRRAAPIDAVRGVTFKLLRSRTMVLLGESGSGKSVTARSIMRLYGASAELAGSVRLGPTELLTLDDRAMGDIRGRRIALVPQDPTGALDPLRRIGSQIAEVLRRHRVVRTKTEARTRAEELLRLVGIADPSRVARSFPHELSGGMRQRAVIAIAVSCDPEVLIADEPTTALDVTVQAQILELFGELQRRLGMALLLVTHDVGVAEQVADEVGVMYAGRLVEHGPADQVLTRPSHPYTAALLESLPLPGIERGSLRPVRGQPPLVGEHISGCPFAPRCSKVIDACRKEEPALSLRGDGRLVACEVAG
jgi:oligopeptide/dipeptide ABC transporter ATP-binding protein